eukprot:1149006-Pelagomonas_calceolata.AAC.1
MSRHGGGKYCDVDVQKVRAMLAKQGFRASSTAKCREYENVRVGQNFAIINKGWKIISCCVRADHH